MTKKKFCNKNIGNTREACWLIILHKRGSDWNSGNRIRFVRLISLAHNLIAVQLQPFYLLWGFRSVCKQCLITTQMLVLNGHSDVRASAKRRSYLLQVIGSHEWMFTSRSFLYFLNFKCGFLLQTYPKSNSISPSFIHTSYAEIKGLHTYFLCGD